MKLKYFSVDQRHIRRHVAWESSACDSIWVASAILLTAALTLAAVASTVNLAPITITTLIVSIIPGYFLVRDLRVWRKATEYRSAKLALLTQAAALNLDEVLRVRTMQFDYYILNPDESSDSKDHVSVVRFNRDDLTPLKAGFTGQIVARIFCFTQKRSQVVTAVNTTVDVTEVDDEWDDVPNIVFDYTVDVRNVTGINTTDAASANVTELLELAYVISSLRAAGF